VVARASPQSTFVYVSGLGTDSSERGRRMWARVKGATENALLRLPFKATYMFRPVRSSAEWDPIEKHASTISLHGGTTDPVVVARKRFPRRSRRPNRSGAPCYRSRARAAPTPILEAPTSTHCSRTRNGLENSHVESLVGHRSASGLAATSSDAVVASGDRLIATARDPRRLEDLASSMAIESARLLSTWPMRMRPIRRAGSSGVVRPFSTLFVNNAGTVTSPPFEQVSSERFKALCRHHFYGVVNVTRAALPIMRKQRSVNLSDFIRGWSPGLPGSAAYHAAKWAVGGFTEALAQEWLRFGVKVCALEPGACGRTGALARTRIRRS